MSINIITLMSAYENIIANPSLETIYIELTRNIDELKAVEQYDMDYIITLYLDKILYCEYKYKNQNRFVYYEQLANLYADGVNMNDTVIKRIIFGGSIAMHGQKIIKKFKTYWDTKTGFEVKDMFIMNMCSYTLPVFLFYLNLLKEKQYFLNLHEQTKMILLSHCNSDDRVFNYIHDKNMISMNDEPFVIELIMSSSKTYIPIKYILRRFKRINEIIPLTEYFHVMFARCSRLNMADGIILIKALVKYYYINTTCLSYFEIIEIFDIYSDANKLNDFVDFAKELYNKVNSNYEKSVIVYCCMYYLCDYHIDNTFQPIEDIYKKNFEQFIISHQHRLQYMKMNDCKYLMRFLDVNKLSDIFTINNYTLSSVLRLMPFMRAKNGTQYIAFNKIRFHLSVYIRMIRRKKITMYKIKLLPILNELKTLKPKKNIAVLKNGTKFYDHMKQKYNNIPPQLLFPGVLQSLNGEYLLREKADGVMVHTLPKNVFPNINFDVEIKAEYIEDLDLYLVHDINIDMNIEDRLMYIHKQHPYGQKYIDTINNHTEMIDSINRERHNLINFLDQPYTSYRWYPKPALMISNMEPFIPSLIDIINMDNKQYDYWLCEDGPINNDGFILTPLDGSREIKIKPKSLYTIDLEYIDDRFYDRDGVEWDCEKYEDNIYNDNTIWRCYNINNKYVAKDFRHDKTKANPHNICEITVNLYKADYKYTYDTVYNDGLINSDWGKIIEMNRKNIQHVLSLLDHSNKSILDCGCGNGKIINYLPNISTYTGVDIDINMLGRAMVKYKSDNIRFSYYDLNNMQSAKWFDPFNVKYDISISINSIMHFCTDIFWEKINSVTEKGAMMVFNLLELNLLEINSNKIFTRKGNMVEYMFPIHMTVKSEPYIDNIDDYLKKYNWEIVLTYKSNNMDMSDNYKWFIAKCNKFN